jgi:hypothetical protein
MKHPRDPRYHLEDICKAGQKALVFVKGMAYESFLGDDKTVYALQIVVGSLVLGCLFFLAVPVFLAPQPMAPVGQELITWVAVGFAGIMLVARLILLPILASHARRAILRSTSRNNGNCCNRKE